MRKFLYLLLAVCTLITTSCARRREAVKTPIQQAQVQQPTEPTFTKVSEFITYRDLCVTEAQEDSLFLTMNEQLLRAVTNVVINRDSVATKHAVITEYLGAPVDPGAAQSKNSNQSTDYQNLTTPKQ